MSATQTAKLDAVLEWLGENAFWNSDLIEVKPSEYGGLGVFWRLGPEDDPDQDRLLLRVPKSNILSPKNSFLYSLLVDHEASDPAVDISTGMHAIVVTFIYELSFGEKSPWHQYLSSFIVENGPIPLCLWEQEEKAEFFNTECDLLNMLDSSELEALYWECVAFAREIKLLVPIPSVFEIEDENNEKIVQFGQYVQAVISRAFAVDKYHSLSLVPGADLFNHLSPIELGELVEVRENVHFECDDDDDLCELCGEIGCPHLETDTELDEEEELNDEDMEEMEEMEEIEEEEENEELDAASIEGLIDKDALVEESESSQSESEHENEHDEHEHGHDHKHGSDCESEGESENEQDYDENKPITLEDIAEIEQESDAETVQDDEEVSTLSLSGDEDDETRVNPSAGESELAAELSDGSKCCDIVLSHLPNQKFNYELFNTYGNELLNPYLLQRYGFVSPGNPNTSCLLSVQMFSDIKRLKKTPKGKVLIETKLQWYEDIGFEIVNELCAKTADSNNSQGHEHEHGHSGNCCDTESVDSEQKEEAPESWQLSPRICCEGYPTEQTVALLRLMQMNFTVFYQKLYRAPSQRKLEKRIQHYLLQGEPTTAEKTVIKRWILERVQRYKPETKLAGPKGDMIRMIIAEEKELLRRATKFLSE